MAHQARRGWKTKVGPQIQELDSSKERRGCVRAASALALIGCQALPLCKRHHEHDEETINDKAAQRPPRTKASIRPWHEPGAKSNLELVTKSHMQQRAAGLGVTLQGPWWSAISLLAECGSSVTRRCTRTLRGSDCPDYIALALAYLFTLREWSARQAGASFA